MQLNGSALNSQAINSAVGVVDSTGLFASRLISCAALADLGVEKALESEVSAQASLAVSLRLTNQQAGYSAVSVLVASADAAVTKRLAASCANSAAAQAQVQAEKLLEGSPLASLTASGNVRKVDTLSASIGTAAAANADLRWVNVLRSSGNPTAVLVSGGLEATKNFSAVLQGSAATSGALRKSPTLGADLTATITNSANLRAVNALRAGLSVALITDSGLTVTKNIFGSTSSAATASGLVARYQGLAGELVASAAAVGSATRINALWTAVETVAGVVIEADLPLTKPQAGAVSESVSTQAGVAVTKALGGSIDASAMSTGQLRKAAHIAADFAVWTNYLSDAQVVKSLLGLCSSTAASQAAIESSKWLAGSPSASLTAVGALKKTSVLSAAVVSTAGSLVDNV